VQGIVTSSIAYYVQGLVIQIRGPVFASAFSPLMMIVVAIMGSFILAENIYLGGYVPILLIFISITRYVQQIGYILADCFGFSGSSGPC
jgi:hypothetical protein